MSHGIMRVLVAGLALGAQTSVLRAQDVELLGVIHGTRPPAEYFARRAAQPRAFEFARALRRMTADARGPGAGVLRRGEAPLGPRNSAVRGRFVFPVVLGLFSDTQGQGPYGPAEVQAQFFDGPNPNGTITDLYREMSGGLVDVRGLALEWQRSPLSAAQVAGGSSGLGFQARVGSFIVGLVSQLDSLGVDWGAFDNDGPDGQPNSGDDDGFVDVLTVMHPTAGAECTGNDRSDRIWSHRWSLTSEGTGSVRTATRSANGDSIRVDDYTIQPVLACSGVSINEIGVYAHELGHGFGLPDLYAVGSNAHAGIGQWGLMGSGSWGCPGPFNPARPCHMSAWSKVALGWVQVEEVPLGTNLGIVSLAPVETGRKVLRVHSGDGSSEFLLLENRQPIGFDDNMDGGGLLVWQVAPEELSSTWPSNTVNSNVNRRGVWLLEADGRAQLASPNGGRGDSGDPFPGGTGNRMLHAGSAPSTRTGADVPMAITLVDIEPLGSSVRFRLLTRYQTVTVRTAGAVGPAGLVAVDGAVASSPELTLRSAPFQEHTIAAEPGEPVAVGVRTGFQGWDDGAPRERTFVTSLTDTTLTARYGGTEYEVTITEESTQVGVDPADVLVSPSTSDGWVVAGSEVAIEARARTGFAFREWTGVLAGAPNPVLRVVSGPLTAGASFDVTFAVATPPGPVPLVAARVVEFPLEVTNATLPVVWTLASGALPQGLRLDATGVLRGTPVAQGVFPLLLGVRDAVGLQGTVALELNVEAPIIGFEVLAGPFLATGHEPDAAERLFLDREGNGNGTYDLGDLRAYVRAHPGLPLSADQRATLSALIVTRAERR